MFALFIPPAAAVAATAVVHAANNLLKVFVVGRHADRGVAWRFGAPAVVAAFLGGLALVGIARVPPLLAYTLAGRPASITAVKVVIAMLMVVFALFELLPRLREWRVGRRYLTLGGLLSGFFGGLSGHQGALRAAFLTKVGLSPAAFVGTSAVIAAFVDLSRLLAYAADAARNPGGPILGRGEIPLIAAGCIAAFLGVLLGTRFLQKATMGGIRVLTGTLLLLIAALLGAGVI